MGDHITDKTHPSLRAGKYRPDIDGLRALAVTLVLLSHLRLPHDWMSGGFIGVDIFFVISGYLITGNIADGIAKGNFSLAGFYERRFRRIIPALVVVLLATSAIAYALFLPSELIKYAHTLLAAMFSYSNLYFYWTRSGYFGADSSAVLLHTWSLGVEEQFYLIIPLCMMLVGRRPKLLRWVIGSIALLSFLAASYTALKNRDMAFYLPHLRAWELLSGAFVAFGMVPRPKRRMMREAMVAISLLFIAGFVAFYKLSIPFPGVTAFFPCAAAVMLILVGEGGAGEDKQTLLSSWLSWRPIVFIGLISYSLYLWHWPVIVLIRLGAIHVVREGTPLGIFFAVAVSMALGALSWKFVEQPFRTKGKGHIGKTGIFFTVATCAAFISVIALVLQIHQGFPARFPEQALAVSKYLTAEPTSQANCFVEGNFAAFDKAACLQEVAGKKNVLLFGDSHAAALWSGLTAHLPDTHILQATVSACPPTLGNYGRSGCSQLRRYIYEDYLQNHKPEAVVLTERWASWEDFKKLEPAIRWFQEHGVPVYVVGPVPEYTVPLPVLLALGIKQNDPGWAGRNRKYELKELDDRLRSALSGRSGVTYASVWQAICRDQECDEYVDGNVPVLGDPDHLTKQASMYVVSRLQQLQELPAS